MAGVFQLLEAVTATLGGVTIPGKLVVAASAAATAANILGHPRLFWLGFILSLLAVAFHIAWALLMYELLKPVNQTFAALGVFVMLVGCAMQALTSLLYLAPLLILQSGSTLSAFTPDQLQALALVFVRLNDYASQIYLVFFGAWCILTGYLVFRSMFLPRLLGVLLAVGGLAWMTYLYPPLAHRLWPAIATASTLGELPLELWLIVMGVNVQRWNQRARAAAELPSWGLL
jgi:hypothetical protein